MVRRSKNPDQGSLFEFAVEPKRSISKISQVKFTPTKKEPAMMVIHYINNEEVSHASCLQSQIEDHKKFNENFAKKHGYKKTFKVMGWDDYWEKFHAGGFELGKAV